MNFNDLQTTTKKFSRQIATYEAAGQAPDMEIQLGFAANVETFLNTEAFIQHGIDPMGFARQMDQVTVENIGNNLSQKIKSAVAKKQPLPDQAVVDAMSTAYDFTGTRTTSEEGMSTEERIVVAEIKKALRSLISSGAFAMLGHDGTKTRDPAEVAFNAIRVQTGPEAKGGKETPPGSVPLDSFTTLVATAAENGIAELEDGNGNSASLDFSAEPVINEHGQALNITGVVELARQEAARILIRNRAKTIPQVEIQLS